MKFIGLPFLFLISISCKSQGDIAKEVNADKFETAINSDKTIQVLDVRTDAEFRSGHIKNALLANWNDRKQFFDRVQYIDKKKPVYIYCLSGGRSAAAADWMRKNGYETVVELSGGILSWKKAGKPLIGTSEEKQMSIEEFEAKIPKDKTALVDIGASWCPPCKKMEPVIEELGKNKSLQFELVKIDAGVNTDVLKKLGVDPIPVFIIYKKGKEVWRKEGIVEKEELIKWLKAT